MPSPPAPARGWLARPRSSKIRRYPGMDTDTVVMSERVNPLRRKPGLLERFQNTSERVAPVGAAPPAAQAPPTRQVLLAPRTGGADRRQDPRGGFETTSRLLPAHVPLSKARVAPLRWIFPQKWIYRIVAIDCIARSSTRAGRMPRYIVASSGTPSANTVAADGVVTGSADASSDIYIMTTTRR